MEYRSAGVRARRVRGFEGTITLSLVYKYILSGNQYTDVIVIRKLKVTVFEASPPRVQAAATQPLAL